MNDKLLWYSTRGAGAVTLVLLTGVVVLGILTRLRVESPNWPRFLTAALHRDISLVALVFLVIHIVTAVVDPFTHLGIVAATVPFGSYYRTFWLGLGTVAFELLLAVIVTSLGRRVIGAGAWRAIHWLGYAAWPIAMAHGLGTGTDAMTPWLLATTAACSVAVLSAMTWRLLASPRNPLGAVEHGHRGAAR